MHNTKHQLIESLKPENKIIQVVSSIDELEKIINMLSKRLREWFSFFLPELDKIIWENDKFAELITKNSIENLRKKYKINTIGSHIKQNDQFVCKRVNKFANISYFLVFSCNVSIRYIREHCECENNCRNQKIVWH